MSDDEKVEMLDKTSDEKSSVHKRGKKPKDKKAKEEKEPKKLVDEWGREIDKDGIEIKILWLYMKLNN